MFKKYTEKKKTKILMSNALPVKFLDGNIYVQEAKADHF